MRCLAVLYVGEPLDATIGRRGTSPLVNLGLTEETWAGGCRGFEMTVRWCVDCLRLVERPELVGDLAFDGWDGVSVCVSRQDGSHLVAIFCGGHDHRGITLVG